MIGRAGLLGLVLALALGCSEGADPNNPSIATSAAARGAGSTAGPELALDEVHVYALDWETEAARERGGERVRGGLVVHGELAVRGIAHEPEGTRVALWLPRVSDAALVIEGQRVPLDTSLLVGVVAEFVIDSTGEVHSTVFDRASAPIARELLLGIVARYDLRGANSGGQLRTLRGGHGLVEVAYHRDGDGGVRRELARVLRFDTAPGLTVTTDQLHAEARIDLDEHRLPIAIEQRDRIADEAAAELGLTADDRFSLRRLRVEPADGPFERLRDPVEWDPNAGPDPETVAAALDRQLAADLTLVDLEIALDSMDGGLLPRPGFVSSAAALLRVDPTAIPGFVDLTRSMGGNGRQLGFDLLAAAGTPAAQAGMWTLLREPAAAGWPERALLIQRFAFVAAPSFETGAGLLELLADADANADLVLQQAILHPLGTVSGRVRDPVLATRMHDALVERVRSEDPLIRAAACAGLGNSRQPDDVPRLIAALDDPDPGVRLEAAAALRTHVVPAATDALLDALDDPDEGVASRALRVLHERHFVGEPSAELIARAERGDYNGSLDRAMVSVLRGSNETGTAERAITAIAGRTTDPELTPTRPSE